MGFIREEIGDVGIESRRESFYLRIGNPNRAFGKGEDDCKMVLYAGEPSDKFWLLKAAKELRDMTVNAFSHGDDKKAFMLRSLADEWTTRAEKVPRGRENGGNVEIPYEHLDDLITALIDLRDKDAGYLRWQVGLRD